MASRTLIRRRKYILGHSNVPILSPSATSAVEQGKFGYEVEQRSVCLSSDKSSVDSNHAKVQYALSKRRLCGLNSGFKWHPTCGISLPTYGSGVQQNFGFPLGVRCFLQSVRTTSNTTRQPEVNTMGKQTEDEKQKQQRKEASPEECDQAVEGLRPCLFQLLLASASQKPEAETNGSAVELFFEKLKSWLMRK